MNTAFKVIYEQQLKLKINQFDLPVADRIVKIVTKKPWGDSKLDKKVGFGQNSQNDNCIIATSFNQADTDN